MADPGGEKYEAVPLGGYGYCIIPPRSFEELLRDLLVSLGLLATTDALLGDSSISIKDQPTAKEEVKTLVKPVPLYYGCRLYDGQFTPQTEPMLFWEAYLWALSRRADPTIGKRSSWGLYPANADDAYIMASALGCQAEPI